MSTGNRLPNGHTGKRVCLFTGASGRLGSTFCAKYADRYHIAAVYRTRPPSQPSQYGELVDPLNPGAVIPDNEHPVFAIRADLSHDADVERVVDLVLARFNAIDLVVNAAVHSVWDGMIESERLLESVMPQFMVNVRLPLKVATTVARQFWRDRDRENVARNRNVVHLSSVAGLRLYSGLGQSVYAASKAALNHLTFHMADEFRAFGVRVNAVAPNSFPAIVATESVAAGVVRMDESDLTGRLLIVDREGDRIAGLAPMPTQTREDVPA